MLEDGRAVTGLVLGEGLGVEGLVEDGHHDGEEPSEEGVEEEVEDADLHCGRERTTLRQVD